MGVGRQRTHPLRKRNGGARRWVCQSMTVPPEVCFGSVLGKGGADGIGLEELYSSEERAPPSGPLAGLVLWVSRPCLSRGCQLA